LEADGRDIIGENRLESKTGFGLQRIDNDFVDLTILETGKEM